MSAKAKRYVIAREHFAAAREFLALVEASPETIRPEAALAAAQLANAHLRAAEFANSWDSFFGGDIETGEPI